MPEINISNKKIILIGITKKAVPTDAPISEPYLPIV